MNLKNLFSIGAIALVAISVGAPPKAGYVPDEVIVKFKDAQRGVGPLVHAQLKTRLVRNISRINYELVKLPKGMTVTQAVAAYKKNSAVESVEPNYYRYKRLVPNDPQYAQQTHLPIPRLPQAWDFTTGSNLIIAVIDDGVDYAHPDLAANTVPGRDWIDGDSNPTPGAGDEHGTHVAGIAAAVTNNGVGVAGAGWNSKIMGIRFNLTVAQSADSMIWATDNGAKIINMSYGGYGPPPAAEAAAVDYAWANDVLLISAAGNANSNTLDSYPDGFAKVISVGATENNDTKAGFSDWGPRVDVATPGVNILSTLPNNRYGPNSGTSMASPYACGIASIVWSQAGPGYTNADVRALLEENCVNVGTWLVNGRLDALNSINSIGTPTPFEYVPDSIDVFEGTWEFGDVSDTQNSDNSRYGVRTHEIPGAATAAAAYMQIQMDRPLTGMRDLKLSIEVAGMSRATMLIFLWDWNQNKWVSFRQFPLDNTDKKIDIDMDQGISKWLNGNRQMRVLLRAWGPNRVFGGRAPNFTFGIDRVALDTIFIVQ